MAIILMVKYVEKRDVLYRYTWIIEKSVLLKEEMFAEIINTISSTHVLTSSLDRAVSG